MEKEINKCKIEKTLGYIPSMSPVGEIFETEIVNTLLNETNPDYIGFHYHINDLEGVL